MRAFAILLVVLQHLIIISRPTIGQRLITAGYLGVWGVNVFFVLSGFLLGNEYVRSLIGSRPFPSTYAFLTRRFLRIYPLYAVAVAVSLALAIAFGHQVPPLYVLQDAFMLQGLSVASVSFVNVPLWTMGVDAAFYVTLPVFMGTLVFATRGRSERAKIRVTAGVLASVVVVSIAYRYVQAVLHPEVLTQFDAETVHIRTLLGMGTAFALGIGIALARLVAPAVPRWISSASIVLGLAMALSAVVAGPVLHGYARLTLLDPMAATCAALIIYGLVQGGLPAATRIASLPGVTSFAALAYAVYLFHYPILEALDAAWLQGAGGVRAFLELAVVGLSVILPVAYVSHRFIEQPFLDLKDKRRPVHFEPAPERARTEVSFP
jgi:peptidoglycan/LPS O-acetylase OafA/YrhL